MICFALICKESVSKEINTGAILSFGIKKKLKNIMRITKDANQCNILNINSLSKQPSSELTLSTPFERASISLI